MRSESHRVERDRQLRRALPEQHGSRVVGVFLGHEGGLQDVLFPNGISMAKIWNQPN
jgi:hypothetical protein